MNKPLIYQLKVIKLMFMHLTMSWLQIYKKDQEITKIAQDQTKYFPNKPKLIKPRIHARLESKGATSLSQEIQALLPSKNCLKTLGLSYFMVKEGSGG